MDNAKLLQILGRIPLFKNLSEQEKKLILSMPKVYELFSPMESIVKEGELSPFFYILLTGKAQVLCRGQELATVQPPQFIGEVGFICQEPRIATVIATEQVMAMKLDAANFNKLPLCIRDTIKDKIIQGLVSRLRQVNSSLVDLKSTPISKSSLDEQYAEYELI